MSGDGTMLGDRFKGYEAVSSPRLLRRTPVIVRVDGKAFHTYTRDMVRPWDPDFVTTMQLVAQRLCQELQGAKLAYVQSDEVSVVLTDYDQLNTEAWFANGVQKMASVAASIATAAFNQEAREIWPSKPVALFDARVFNVPREEVVNYFVWRQRDATRNSIQNLAHHHCTQAECDGLNGQELQELLFQKHRINWSDTPDHLKRGSTVVYNHLDGMWEIHESPPLFTADRAYIESRLPQTEKP